MTSSGDEPLTLPDAELPHPTDTCGMVRRRAAVANPVSNYVFALLHTVNQEGIEVLLVKRHLIQTLVDGRTHRGVVPNWAGQWGLIAARPLVSQSMEETVQGAVLAQTGVDLSDPASAERYRIVSAEPRTLTGDDDKPITVLFLTFMPEGLRIFTADATDRVAAGKVRDGAIAALEIEPVSRALTRIAPPVPPPEGWAGLVSSRHARGHEFGFLGSGGAVLTSQLVERTAMVPTAARVAVQTLAACAKTQAPVVLQTPPEGASLTGLEIVGARPHGGRLWYQTYAPGEVIYIHAVANPTSEQALPIEWQGGEPDPEGRPDWRILPLDRLSAPEAPFSVWAVLRGDRLEARIAVVPELIGVETTRAHFADLGGGAPDIRASGAVWVRAVMSPPTEEAFRHLNWYGGRVDPRHPFDRRLVSLQEIVNDGKGVAVEANRGLQ